MGRRSRMVDEFQVAGVVERLALYDLAPVDAVSASEDADGDLAERAATFLRMIPRNQRRETIEALVSPNDTERGRRAVDALIESALAEEDESGRLRRVCVRLEESNPAADPVPETRAETSLAPRKTERRLALLAHALRLARLVASPVR